MDLEKYRVLLCVTETGSLAAAAEQMNYTVSGISRMVAALERELGFSLFIRMHEGVRPTEECIAMLPYIRNFVFSGDACLQASENLRHLETGTVTIGTAYSAFYIPLSGIIAAFRELHPRITLRIQNGYSSDLARQLEEHRLELCLISRRPGDFIWIPLCRDEIVAWVPENSALAQKDRIPLIAFCSEPYIDIVPNSDSSAQPKNSEQEESDNSRIFRACRLQPNTQFTVTDSALAYAMTEAGLGITMNNRLNSRNLTGSVAFRPLTPPQFVEIGIAAPKKRPPAADAFLEFLERRTENLVTMEK